MFVVLCEQYVYIIIWFQNQLLDVVVFVESMEDVVDVVRICVEYNVFVIFFGIGMLLEGYVNVLEGGIFIDFNGMNWVLDVYVEDFDCVVEVGVICK